MIAIVFPGQGSQRPGMGQELIGASPEAADVFRRVSDAVGFDVAEVCAGSDEETLRETQNAQLALYTCGVAAFRALMAANVAGVGAVAGHSIGEYAAAVAAGAFSIEDGARLVQTRGNLMAASGRDIPGTMAAIIGLDRALLEEACREAGGIAVVANDNSPGQLVISGEAEAVRRASELAKAKGAKRVLPLNVSGAFHSPLMGEPARQMGEALRRVGVVASAGRYKLYANVTSEPVEDLRELPGLLEQQLFSPVRWTETVQHMVRDGVSTLIECGAGEVLSGLIRRIAPSAQTLRVQDLASLESARSALECE